MKEKHKVRLHRINTFLDRPIAVIITLVLLFVYFLVSNHAYQAQGRRLLESTNDNTKSTNQVVKGQSDILQAIKQLALDTKLDNNEKTNIIICMLQVPVAQRTTDLQEQCRTEVEHSLSNQTTSTNPGGSSTTTTPSNSPPSTNLSNPSSTGGTTTNNTTNNTTTTTTPAAKPDNDGIEVNLPLLPTIHIGSPF